MNYCRNYEITFGNKLKLRVVEKRYFDKLVKRIQELEAKQEFKKWGDLDNTQFEEYMNQFVPKQKVKEKKKEIKKTGQYLYTNVDVCNILEELLEEK